QRRLQRRGARPRRFPGAPSPPPGQSAAGHAGGSGAGGRGGPRGRARGNGGAAGGTARARPGTDASLMLPTGLSRALADAGYAPDTRSPRPAAGGSISRAWTLRTRDGVNLFLKTGPAEAADAFEAERDALAALAATATLRVPRPLAAGCTSDTAWLLLEFVDLDGPRARAAPALGEGLARLHRVQ